MKKNFSIVIDEKKFVVRFFEIKDAQGNMRGTIAEMKIYADTYMPCDHIQIHEDAWDKGYFMEGCTFEDKYNKKRLVKKFRVKVFCHPNDVFDIQKGREIAFSRLWTMTKNYCKSMIIQHRIKQMDRCSYEFDALLTKADSYFRRGCK